MCLGHLNAFTGAWLWSVCLEFKRISSVWNEVWQKKLAYHLQSSDNLFFLIFVLLQLKKMFFLFPDPHFKQKKHKWRIIRWLKLFIMMFFQYGSWIPGGLYKGHMWRFCDNLRFYLYDISSSCDQFNCSLDYFAGQSSVWKI